MAKPVSVKHLQIDQARSNVTLVVTVAVVVIIFSLMSAKALLSEAAYQRKVINARHDGLHILQQNVTNAQQLVDHYDQVFEGSNPQNIIGGQNIKDVSAIPPNGDNARIVLDALPSKYDFPALLSSVNYILKKDNVGSISIGGTDDSVQAANSGTPNPKPTTIALTLSGSTTYSGVQTVIHDFEASIRPFDITSISLNGTDANLSFSFQATTYYQQSKSLDLTMETIK